MSGVSVTRCTNCDWQGLPRRLWCPSCGSADVASALIESGTVAATTTIRRAPATPSGSQAVRLGEIELDGGGKVIARLSRDVSEGMHVALAQEDGAVIAPGGSARANV